MFKKNKIALLICALFFVAYSILSLIRFEHYGAFGFDLGVIDQVIWKYSQFKTPITTIHFYPLQNILIDHFEPIFIPLSMFYWIWSSPRMLLLLEIAFICFSGIPLFLLTKEKKLHHLISYSLLLSYLSFYGVQHAMWFDVHSVSFGAAFIAWLLYFLQRNNIRWITISFILAITSKENIAALTFLISFVWFIHTRKKIAIYLMGSSLLYLIFLFGIYFPHVATNGYHYANNGGLFSNILNVSSFYDTSDKQQVLLYTASWFGFLPILNPIFLIPVIGDLWNYFVIASDLKAAQGLFMHYRITIAPLMVWATIYTIARYKWLNNRYIALYLLICALALQYILHLPLSYLTKQWFWTKPSGVNNINQIISYLPNDASVVSQNNITPHISQRELIFTLWPEKKNFAMNSPCGQESCDWFRWSGNPEYLIVDFSPEWDIRHLLANREEFIQGVNNLEKMKVIKKHQQKGSAILYKVLRNP